MVGPDKGFHLLAEEPGRELVVGSVGRFWKLRIPYASVTPADFPAFSTPGYGKLAWNLRVDPREGGGAWVSAELRVTTTDEAAWARFRRYWWLVGRFSHAIRRLILHQFQRELGRAGAGR